MNILVTGGGGFLGQAICRLLVARGYRVSSFSRQAHPALDMIGVTQIHGDLANAEAVRAACASRDAVFHNAAKAGAWGAYADYHCANVIGTQNVLDACRAQGIARLVYTSTPSVTHRAGHAVEGGNEIDTPYGDPFRAAYPTTKAIAERAVLAANGVTLATIALRPRLIWGPGDPHLLPGLVARARAGRLRLIDGGGNRIDTTYVDNAAQAHVDAFDHLWPGSACSGKAYFISNGEPRPLRDIVNALLCAADAPQVSASIPYRLAYGIGAACELAWRSLPLRGEPPLTRFLAEQLATPHWYDISAAERDFGYHPRISLDEGFSRLAQ
ncbi:MAG: NAD-dependent epimerase/dehydratase family protein [Xanthomonadales bacterium]|nr:NAD-dependent epimerase/dehydratase family protein [Xanthomonadales bacterium]MDZ4377871.1 2-alkyl-3-oxoalkanoate reductase [Xanthomonadaceae bacterium]